MPAINRFPPHPMRLGLIPIVLYLLSIFSIASAQTVPTVGELMQLESQLKLQKLKNELTQTNPTPPGQLNSRLMMTNMPPLDSALAKSAEHPRYIAAFGIAPDYRGYLTWGEQIYPLYPGAIVRHSKVIELTPQNVKLRHPNGRIRSIPFAFDTHIARPITTAPSTPPDLPPLPAATKPLRPSVEP